MEFSHHAPINRHDHLLRVAVLMGYENRCLYCRRHVELANLQLDHIISKYIYKSGELVKYNWFGLPKDFHVDSIYNSAPSCWMCNSTKSEHVLHGLTDEHLRIVDSKVDKVEKLYHKLQKSKDVDKAIAVIGASVSGSNLTIEKVYNIITNEEHEFKEVEYVSDRTVTYSSKTIYIEAFLPTILEPRGSCAILFKSLKIRDCMITFNHNEMKELFLGIKENNGSALPRGPVKYFV